MSVGSTICATVEGSVDEAVAKKLIAHVGASPGEIYTKHGKTNVRKGLNGYVTAARYKRWMVLIDLDQDADCAPLLRKDWLPASEPRFCFCVAVRAVEAWLLADAIHISRYLEIDQTRIPSNPEELPDPNAAVVELAGGSRNRGIRRDMVPRPGSGRKTGPLYPSFMTEFIRRLWRPDRAAERSESLQYAIERLRRL